MGNEYSHNINNNQQIPQRKPVPLISELHQSFHPDKISQSPNILTLYNESNSSGTDNEDSLSPSFDPFEEFLSNPELLKTQETKRNSNIYFNMSEKISLDKDDSDFYKYPTYNNSVHQEEVDKTVIASKTSTCLKEVKVKETIISKYFMRKNGMKQTTKGLKQNFIRKEMHFASFDEESSYKVLMAKNKALNDLSLIIHLLKSIPFIKDINKEHSIELIEDLQYVLFESESQIMKENSIGTSVFFIKQGKVNLTVSAQKTLLKTMTGPFVLGERVFVNDTIRQWDVFAHTPVYAYVLTKHKLKSIQQYINKTIEPSMNRLYLDQCQVLNLLTTEQKDRLSQHMHKEFYGNNRTIINQYDKPNTLYIFFSGTAEKTIYHYKNNSVVYQLKPGDVFAYDNLIYPKLTHISVISIKSTVCLSICYDIFKTIFEEDDYYLSLRNLFLKAEMKKNKYFSGIYSQMDNLLLNNFIVKYYSANEIIIPKKTQLNEGVYIILEGDVYEETDPRVKLKERFGSILYSEYVYMNKQIECQTNIRASTDCFIAQITKTLILFHLGKNFDKMNKLLIKKFSLQKSKTFSIFQGAKTFIDDLCENIYEVHFNKGDLIYSENVYLDKAYFIQKGKAMVIKNNTEQICYHNTFLGLSALTTLLNKDKIQLINNTLALLKRNEKAIAVKDTDCLVIEREQYIKSFKDSNSQMLLYITKRLYLVENKFDIMKMVFYPLFETCPFTRGMPFLAKISYFEEQVTFCKIYSKFLYTEDNQMNDLQIIFPILKTIDSFFISKLVATYISDEHVYYIYSYTSGNNLSVYLDLISPCNYELARIWGMQLLTAIKALHNKKIMHRTINPDNIMIDSNGNICLKQLNKAALYPIKNSNVPVSSDIHFLAPEMLYGHSDYKLSVDFWAFGVLLYLLICKTYPFGKNESDQKKIIGAIINEYNNII